MHSEQVRSALITLLVLCTSLAYGQQLNRKLIAELDTIWKADQRYRSAEKQHGVQNAEEDADNMKKQSVIDIENLHKIGKIIAGHGYPGKSLVGEAYQSVAFMVIQHNDREAREKYLPVIIAAAEKGELRNSSMAIMVDRSKMDKGEKQVYGSQLRETTEGMKLYPIADESQVNIRRGKVGLPPLESYLKHWNINYRVPGPEYQNPASLYYTAPSPQGPASVVAGGNEALYKKLVYPDAAKEKGISGYVTVELTVDKDGRPTDVSVARSLGYGCDEEAVRAVKETTFVNTSGKAYETRLRIPFPYPSK